MNLRELTDHIGTMTINSQFGGLPIDLVGALGSEVRVPAGLHPHADELARKLVGVDFSTQGAQLELQLYLEDEGKTEALTIHGIVKAALDHGYGGTMGKYYVTLDTGVTIRILVGFSVTESQKYQAEHFGGQDGAGVLTRMI